MNRTPVSTDRATSKENSANAQARSGAWLAESRSIVIAPSRTAIKSTSCGSPRLDCLNRIAEIPSAGEQLRISRPRSVAKTRNPGLRLPGSRKIDDIRQSRLSTSTRRETTWTLCLPSVALFPRTGHRELRHVAFLTSSARRNHLPVYEGVPPILA